MPDLLAAQEDAGVKRTRRRTESLKIDREDVAERIKTFHDNDSQDRSDDIQMRIQRYAKLRMWAEGKDWPWEDSSDVALDDMMTNSLRVQDTLHNAVMSQRPAIVTKALDGKEDEDKQSKIDNLIDFQVFVEQEGEKFIGECADAYVNDGVFTVFTPWVREDREIADVRFFPPIPDDMVPVAYFKQTMLNEYPKAVEIRKDSKDGWDWEVKEDADDEPIKASFYTRDDDKVELVLKHKVRVYDGPRPRVVEYEDLLYPHRCDNLQIPGPANPKGATHVIMRDYPTVDEIKRLKEDGFYDLITDEEMDQLAQTPRDRSYNEAPKDQKDAMAGTTESQNRRVDSHRTLTRIVCFDLYDIDDDGIDEDVVWWMILETKTILKAKMLTEMWPANPPRRPFAGASFIPVRGRYTGISLLEMMEASHDQMKLTFDQTFDSGTITNAPFGFYRAASNVKPEVIRLWPGELYPLGDPQNDIYFPTFSQTAQSFGINMLTMLQQNQERLTMQNAMSFGGVPKGQASALRTAQGQQTLLGQSEARPERILRRFFMGLTEVWAQIHELNQRFLPAKKKFMVSGYSDPSDDPYREIKSTQEIEGRFQFDFRANVLNTSKQALQDAMQQMLPVFINPLTVQMGLMLPDNMYRLLRDFGRALGQDPRDKQYLTPPTPMSNEPGILAEEAIHAILMTEDPKGYPLEGAQAHLQKLVQFMQSDQLGYLTTPEQLMLFKSYLQKVQGLAVQEVQRQQMAAVAGQFAGQFNNNAAPQAGAAGGGAPPQTGNPMVQGNEVIDEGLPSAKGPTQ